MSAGRGTTTFIEMLHFLRREKVTTRIIVLGFLKATGNFEVEQDR